MSTSVSDTNSGNGKSGSSHYGSFIKKAWTYVSLRVRRGFNRVRPDLEGIQSEIDESHGNDEAAEMELSEISIAGTPPGVLIDQIGPGDLNTNAATNITDDLPIIQKIGLNVVKYLVMPVSLVGAQIAVNLFQEFTENNTVTASEAFYLKPFFASAVGSISLGGVCFALSTTKGKFRGKAFILKVIILLTSVATIGEIAFAAVWQFASLV